MASTTWIWTHLGEASSCGLCHCCHCKLTGYQYRIFQKYWPASWAEVCCCHWSHSIAGFFTPGTSLSRSDHCPGSMSSVGTHPKAGHQPLAEAAYVNPPTMQHRLCLALGGHRHPPSSRAAPSAGRTWVLAQEFCTGPVPSPRSTQWVVTPDLYLYGDPEERKARATDSGGISRRKDCSSSPSYCRSSWGCTLAWRLQDALCSYSAVPCYRLELSAHRS